MRSWSALRSCAWRVAFAGGCAGASWSLPAWAESNALELQPLSVLQEPLRDRSGTEASRQSEKSRADQLRFGALLGVGFPRPLSVEGLVKLEQVVAFGLEYSALPQISVSNVQVTSWAVAGSVRAFPFRGPFFVGLRAGRQHLTANATVSGYGYTVPVSLGVDTSFLNPQLGFLWTWQPGISLSIAAGVQIPLSSNASSSVQAAMPTAVQQAIAPTQRKAEDVAASIGQTTLPTLDLLRIGVLF
jgi:hypothetical protein